MNERHTSDDHITTDLWICIPHLASDDYVRQIARLLKATLKPHLRIYVEFSNEIWNPAFSQT